MKKTAFGRAMCLLAVVSLSACASSPKKIQAAYVSPVKYQNYDCDQLAAEQAALVQKANELTGNLNKRRKNDKIMMGVGLVVAWPALFFLKGNGGKKAQLAAVKGDYDAVQTSQTQKKCGITPAEAKISAATAEAKPQ
jgi:type II secretory pathway component PulL